MTNSSTAIVYESSRVRISRDSDGDVHIADLSTGASSSFGRGRATSIWTVPVSRMEPSGGWQDVLELHVSEGKDRLAFLDGLTPEEAHAVNDALHHVCGLSTKAEKEAGEARRGWYASREGDCIFETDDLDVLVAHSDGSLVVRVRRPPEIVRVHADDLCGVAPVHRADRRVAEARSIVEAKPEAPRDGHASDVRRDWWVALLIRDDGEWLVGPFDAERAQTLSAAIIGYRARRTR